MFYDYILNENSLYENSSYKNSLCENSLCENFLCENILYDNSVYETQMSGFAPDYLFQGGGPGRRLIHKRSPIGNLAIELRRLPRPIHPILG